MQGIFDEKLTCLYTAEMVLAISHLHSLGVVHRDLKPVRSLLSATLALALNTQVAWPTAQGLIVYTTRIIYWLLGLDSH